MTIIKDSSCQYCNEPIHYFSLYKHGNKMNTCYKCRDLINWLGNKNRNNIRRNIPLEITKLISSCSRCGKEDTYCIKVNNNIFCYNCSYQIIVKGESI
jgi:DNA-directed RNA polymerase subunit RPC12/RpoP